MKKYLIDTSVIIAFLRGNKTAVDYLKQLEGELTSSFVCLSELYEGVFRVKKDKDKIEKGVLDFFAGLTNVFSIDEAIKNRWQNH